MTGLLFLPTPEHRDAILGAGVGGATAPVRYKCGCGSWTHEGCAACWVDGRRPSALILIWRGEVAQEGAYRLARVVARVAGLSSISLPVELSADEVVELAGIAERGGLGTIIRGDDRV